MELEQRALKRGVAAVGSLAPNSMHNQAEIIMDDNKKAKASTSTHQPARPLKFFKDKYGDGWLCDQDIDFEGDLEKQGCWRCEDMAFPTGG